MPWVRLALVGAAGGLLSGAFGVGGGILMVPLLIMFAGMDQRRASATSLAAIVPAAIAGAITFFANGEVDLLAALFVAVGGIAGSWVGSWLLRHLSLGWLRWLFIALLVAVAVRLLLVVPVRGEGPLEFGVGPAIGLIGLGIVIGIASGLFGIGGGVIAVPVLIAVFGFGDLLAKGTSLLAMIPTALSGSIANVRAKMVSVRDGLIVGIAASVASFGGVALAFIIPPGIAGVLFGALLIVIVVLLSVRAIKAQRAAKAERDAQPDDEN
jgi:uncharacterized membrane protein YfcA